MKLLCPVCKQPLEKVSKSWRCENNHNFDEAKSGYLNLLQSGGNHGDNKEMVKARTAFLESGAYAFLKQKLIQLIGNPDTLADFACGEGYYTSGLCAKEIIGIDMSKDALIHAATLSPAIRWALPSIFDAPLEDNSCDVVLTCFAPFAKEEIERILRPGGRFIFVTPGPHHLYELKEALYETPYRNIHKDLDTNLSLVHEETISSSWLCHNEQLYSLFAMTPYAYRTGKRGKEKLSTIEALHLTAEFVIRIYQKS